MNKSYTDSEKKRAVLKFQEYLRIRTDHPDPDYDSAVSFLNAYASDLGLDIQHVDLGGGRVVVVMTWEGTQPSLRSLVLNSHMDVVPAFEESWKHDPWAAVKEENGDIYGRGTQDMKSVGIQYLEAVRRLKRSGEKLKRTVHIMFLPDEEIGGPMGATAFVKTPQFKALDAGVILDEGLACPGDGYSVFYGERATWHVNVKCEGNPGHGSRFIEDTAAEKLRRVINRFLDFREEEKGRMEGGCLQLGDVTTINLTMLEGGVQPNVVPNEFSATFDVRVPLTVDLDEFKSKMTQWCEEIDEKVTCTVFYRADARETTSVDKDGPWWRAFSGVFKERDVSISAGIFPAGTDGSCFRQLGYPAFGFSPICNTPILLHDDNEFLNEAVFLEGVEVYYDLIPALANVLAFD